MERELDGDRVRGEVSPGRTQGGCRPTGVPPGEGAMGGPLAVTPSDAMGGKVRASVRVSMRPQELLNRKC